MTTILTWLWKQPGGRTDYRACHVNIWADQVRRNLTIPHRLACVTDMPEGIDPSIDIIAPPRDFEDVRIPTWGEDRGLPQCLRRIALFRPDAADVFGDDDIISMDTDAVVGGSLDPLFDEQPDFRMYRGTTAARPYNGSMVRLKAGARSQVYTEFTPERAVEAGKQFLGSDQAWISHILGWGEATWGPEHGVVWYGSRSNADAPTHRLMFFPGNPKPWQVAQWGVDPWISEHYRRSRAGRCLILGYEAHVWDDAAAALESGSFDAVIASPEAAEHWPGEILAVASDNREAARLAWMHGYDDVTFCGVRRREAA